MKLSAKTISSSPARTDKFPSPLMMRFLRTNGGSRSRSRSRRSRISSSSPIFVLRKRNQNSNNIQTQEPSSPKVTCMGQVRARQQSSSTPRHCCCSWIKKPNLTWPKWPFFRRKPNKHKQDSVNSESNYQERASSSVVDNACTNNSSTPPGNALLLTRCRSMPYRSSSLASRFWSSPLRNNEDQKNELQYNNEKPSSSSLSQFDSSNDDEARPVVLTRCKSDPARIGYRLDLECNCLPCLST